MSRSIGFFGQNYISGDSDARAFLTATGITDATITTAINDLVVGLKGDGLWTKMKAIYPFVGGTSTTHKYNLKDPRDLDAAYRLTFTGGFTHSSTGCLPSGTNSQADTYINPSLNLLQNDVHMSFYNRTLNSKNESVEIGLLSPSNLYLAIDYQTPAGGILDFISNLNNTGLTNYTGGSILGLYLTSRGSSSQLRKFINGSLVQTVSATSTALANTKIILFSNQTTERTNRECAFSSFGDNLTNTDVSNLYTLVQAFQTYLGRNV